MLHLRTFLAGLVLIAAGIVMGDPVPDELRSNFVQGQELTATSPEANDECDLNISG
ncbi:MAG: hypothetical protein JSV21_03485 [Nitrospirota bacterium]|nr:MAG: hypothetical protein JSV21_03485 [Nitrospirota bacterium]